MKIRLYSGIEVDFTQWALPLEIWWVKGTLCFEILCFSIVFGVPERPYQIILDELE
jgi:hypothetical protein